jgi:hypothetical protein
MLFMDVLWLNLEVIKRFQGLLQLEGPNKANIKVHLRYIRFQNGCRRSTAIYIGCFF